MKPNATNGELLRGPQLALDSKAQKASPSPPAEGGEGWGEEGHSCYGWPMRQQLDAPLPGPLPARSSRGEGVGAVAYPAASPVNELNRLNELHEAACVAEAHSRGIGVARRRHKRREASSGLRFWHPSRMPAIGVDRSAGSS